MSLSQEQPPTSVDEELREYLVRRFLEIGVVLEKPSKFTPRKEMPYKPQVGDVHYFGDPGTHSYDAAITAEGFWGLTGTGWLELDLAGGGGGGSIIEVEDEGISLTTDVTKFNFVGDGVEVTEPVADEMLVTIPGAVGGSDIEVEDNAVSLTSAVTKFNFVGFDVTEPVNDEIQISLGVVGASSEYCPGYSYSFVSSTSFTVDGVDAENLFYVGRRLKFDKAGVLVYGAVLTSVYGTDTTITMTMEGGDVVPADPFDVCLVSSATAWSPIAGDPFGGDPINDIVTGIIGSTQWWFAVGDNGKIATSSDKGATWTIRTTITTEDFSCCVYDSINETFWAGAVGGIIASTTNGTSITEDSTSIAALTGTGTDNIIGFAYTEADDTLMLIYTDGVNYRNAVSADQGATWVTYAGTSNVPPTTNNVACKWQSATQRINDFYYMRNANSIIIKLDFPTDTGWALSDNVGSGLEPTCQIHFWDSTGGAAASIYGTQTGTISGYTNWTGNDTTTFTDQINGGAHSQLHDRVVIVGDNGLLGYCERVDKDNVDAWVSVANGFNPLTNVNAVDWNEDDAMFVAVAQNGQICRSTNGTN